MIYYDVNSSPFFIANRQFCESIEKEITELGGQCTGSCTSYGYDLKSTVERKRTHYTFKHLKYQTTRNGVIVPLDATDHIETEVTITGLKTNANVSLGKSKWRRLFAGMNKENFPSPYYFKSSPAPNKQFELAFAKLVNDLKVLRFRLRKGKAVIKITWLDNDLPEVITKLETLFELT